MSHRMGNGIALAVGISLIAGVADCATAAFVGFSYQAEVVDGFFRCRAFAQFSSRQAH